MKNIFNLKYFRYSIRYGILEFRSGMTEYIELIRRKDIKSMKIRVTLMTENNKHFDEKFTYDELNTQVMLAWKLCCHMLIANGDPLETVTV